MDCEIYFFVLVIFLFGCEQIPECGFIYGEIEEYCEPKENLNLDSGGGNIMVAIDIANRTKFTHVEGNCSSACVMIASRGDHRSACIDSWFGFHQASTNQATNVVLAFYREDERVDFHKVKDLISSVNHYSMSSIPSWKALEFGLIDEILHCEP